MSETAQGRTTAAPIDAFFEFLRSSAEAVSDMVTPPEEARQHFRASRVEFWRGVRALVDHRIDHLSRGGQGGSRVTVE